MPKAPENLREFNGLLKVVEFLRGPDGCPWDKEQTHKTLTRYAIEEACELAEAIDSGKAADVRDELGDVLLQVVLHSEIARQAGTFDIFDVIENLNRKMIRRHPHVFGDTKASTSTEVLQNWAAIKAAEKGQTEGPTARPLSFDLPSGLPALLGAHKIGEKTGKVDFDFQNSNQCWDKVQEEIAELEEALNSKDKAEIEAELGDVLFSVAQLARHLNLDSEQCLRLCNRRFEERFQNMQARVTADGKTWGTLPAHEKERYWKAAKKE